MFWAGEPPRAGAKDREGESGGILAAIARPRFCFEGAVVMSTNTGEKLTARIAPLFVQLYNKGTIGTHGTTIVSTLFSALVLTVVTPRFAAVYTVDYAARAAAVVVTIPLVVLVLILQCGKDFGPAAGTVAG